MCSICIIRSHRSNPFHRLAKWNGSFFARTSLESLGMVIHLRHKSERCPKASPHPSNVTLVDTNGIQLIKVGYCQCPGYVGERAKIKQLVEYGLFPASVKRPQTLFTFKVLRDFHLETTCSKTSAYDYIRKIGRITDRIFVNAVPVCT